MKETFVSIMMGSDSDLATVPATLDTLDTLEVPWEVKITSAHRTPHDTHEHVRDAEARGCSVYIAAAGLAAHLAGTVAGLTIKPVIGIPIEAGPLKGHDALLSTVQMPGGIPVACVAIGKAGAKNAAYLAAQIMATSDPNLADRLAAERSLNAESVRNKDRDLQVKLGKKSVDD